MHLKKEQFFAAITTTKGSDWRDKIKEIDKLELKQIAIFPTCLEEQERKELYNLLEKTNLGTIPFVHLRSDMKPEELDYFVKKWSAEVFNTHSQKEFPFRYDYSKYRDMIYIENTYTPFDEKEIKNFAGLCLDFSHLENDRLLRDEHFKQNKQALQKFPVGCNHISAIKKQTRADEYGKSIYAVHSFENLSEFDYLKNYPGKYFSNYIAIELENSLTEQLKVIDYILKL